MEQLLWDLRGEWRGHQGVAPCCRLLCCAVCLWECVAVSQSHVSLPGTFSPYLHIGKEKAFCTAEAGSKEGLLHHEL